MPQPTDETPETLVAACVQFDVHREDVTANLRQAEEGIAEAAKASARLCVLPEMWSTSFLTTYEQSLLDALKVAFGTTFAEANRAALVIGRVGLSKSATRVSPNASMCHIASGSNLQLTMTGCA